MRPSAVVLPLIVFVSTAAAQVASVIQPKPPYADSLPDATHAPLPKSILDAEAEGARWVRRLEPTTQFGDLAIQRWAKAAPRKCVDGYGSRDITSGEFLIGGDIVAARGERKVWWEPMHPAQGYSLVVRAVSLTTPADTFRYFNTGWAIGGSPRGGLTGPIFYASGIAFPAAGRWLVIATSGPDWGCAILGAG